MDIPIYTRLEAYHQKNRIPFAMPGHKNLRGLAGDLQVCDVTELDATADLHNESGAIRRANELLTRAYGTRQSFITVGGSTAGVMTMIISVMKPGQTLLASADCHASVINTCALCGYGIRLLPAEIDDEFGITGDLRDFEISGDVGAVIVTSPNYYGRVKDIRKLADKCRAAGVPLLTDEAHGAHFIKSGIAHKSAVNLGADMVCHSAHKTLNALNGAAYLHVVSENIDIDRVRRVLAMVQTSSPSYPIAASADIARATLCETDYGDILGECAAFLGAIADTTRIEVLKNDDITRLVLTFAAYDISGFDVARRLSEYYGIDIEMADPKNIVLIASPWNTHHDFMKLFGALREICADAGESTQQPNIIPPPPPSGKIFPSRALYAARERVSLNAAAGRVCAETVTAYPPGTAVALPGAVLDAETVKYIEFLSRAGAKLTGVHSCTSGKSPCAAVTIEVIK